MAEVGVYNMAAVVLATLVTMVTSMALPGAKVDTDIHFFMPGVQPQKPDTYMCFPHVLPQKTIYLTGFEPHANKSIAHHVMLYGCTDPGSSIGVWNCGEMMSRDQDKAEVRGPVCKTGAKILYAWAMDAPELKLPEDVGFKVGGDTSIKYLVLQVHYKDVTQFLPPTLAQDHSGMNIKNTDQPQPKLAGVYLMGTDGEIPAHETVYMETACSYGDEPTLHPFAFRTHAHTHGEVISGYRVRDGEWKEIGRESPKKPQMFYPVTNPGMTVKTGDMLAARCTMVNNENRTVQIGATQEDEMCNFYMMYWTDSDTPLSQDYCFSDGPPTWKWSNEPSLNAVGAPDDASVIPGTDKVIKATQELMKKTEEKITEVTSEMKEDFLRLLDEIRQQEEEPSQQGYGDEMYPREMLSDSYEPYPLEDLDQREYNEILREYPEDAYGYQRDVRAQEDGYESDGYQDLLREYYNSLQ